MEDGVLPAWKPNFFKPIPHPLRNEPGPYEEKPLRYVLVEGKKSYWERRKNGDWSDMPNLWGPYE
jgi:hypothetical protein